MTIWRMLVILTVVTVSLVGKGTSTAWGQNTSPSEDDLAVTGGIIINTVTFTGATGRIFTVVKDKGGDYPVPHWTLERDAKNEAQSPVCYLRDTIIKIDATFKLKEGMNPLAESISISGVMDGYTVAGETINIGFPADITSNNTTAKNGKVTVNNGVIKIEGMVSDKALSNVILCLDKIKIKWKVKLSDGVEKVAGASEHRIYVVRAALPAPAVGEQSTKLYHTVLHVSCKAAEEKANPQETIDAIWSRFAITAAKPTGTPFQTWNGEPKQGFTYYKVANPAATTTQQLITGYDAKCNAWADFMRDLLKVQGIAAISVGIKPDVNVALVAFGNPPAGYEYIVGGLFVKNWTLVPEEKPKMGVGVAGQNNADPASKEFNDHALVRVNTTLYDPSYGKGPYNDAAQITALRSWQDASLDAVTFNARVINTGVVVQTAWCYNKPDNQQPPGYPNWRLFTKNFEEHE